MMSIEKRAWSLLLVAFALALLFLAVTFLKGRRVVSAYVVLAGQQSASGTHFV
jgi:hypothetical protein